MPKSRKKPQPRLITYRLRMTPAERKRLHRLAREAGYPSASSWIRYLVGLPDTGWGEGGDDQRKAL